MKIFNKWKSKRAYIFELENQGTRQLLNARLTKIRIEERKAEIIKLENNKEAIQKEIEKIEFGGYWECQDCGKNFEKESICQKCHKTSTFVKPYSKMVGQERYESEKERKEVDKMIDDIDTQIKRLEDLTKQSKDANDSLTSQGLNFYDRAKEVKKMNIFKI